MAEHYYSRTPNIESDPKYWDFKLRGNNFRFKTDHGVFSKKEVDFGSRLLIEAFELAGEAGKILDVGCGYGPIGLSIAKSCENIFVHMVDVNERALSLAKENAQLNKISNVQIYESDRLTNVKDQDFSAIVTNPPIRAGKKVVHEIFEQSATHLRPGGGNVDSHSKKAGGPFCDWKTE